MTLVDRLISTSQPDAQLSEYVMLLQWCMSQPDNQDEPGVNLRFSLEQEKQMSRQYSQATTSRPLQSVS